MRGTLLPVAAWRSPAWRHGVAQIADVEVDTSTGKVTVRAKARRSRDCGLIVNPDGSRIRLKVKTVIQGSSRALMEEVNFDSAGVKT